MHRLDLVKIPKLRVRVSIRISKINIKERRWVIYLMNFILESKKVFSTFLVLFGLSYLVWCVIHRCNRATYYQQNLPNLSLYYFLCNITKENFDAFSALKAFQESPVDILKNVILVFNKISRTLKNLLMVN